MTSVASVVAQADANLLKVVTKLVNRIERILVPSNSLVHNSLGARLDVFMKKVKAGHFFVNVVEFTKKRADLLGYDAKTIEPLFRQVNWEAFEQQLYRVLRDGDEGYAIPAEVMSELSLESDAQQQRLSKAINKELVRSLQRRNGYPVFPGKWRKDPFPARTYQWLSEYRITSNIGPEEGVRLQEQLHTPLDGFLGQAYNYDDHDLTEEWMVSFQDIGSTGPSEDDVIRTQIESLLEIMMASVQDRVCTDRKVLQKEPLQLNKDIQEVPVWGLDSYTRRMIEIALEDRVRPARRTEASLRRFIEKKLLPAINAQSPDHAHNINYAIDAILENPSVLKLDAEYATALKDAVRDHSTDMFRIHPKGTGVVCINPDGIQPHQFVTEYLGELYPAYRWCERMDVVEQAQQTFELKPTLPDFYNILLERPRQDPDGYGLLYVDASQRANVGSSCSHSCDANCTSAVVARDGKLVIALTSTRHIAFGEELTMDYYSITTSAVEWKAAICLCGSTACRGSFLHYATQHDLQQVLTLNCGPLWRYASLLRACAGIPLSKQDRAVLDRHGMKNAAFGKHHFHWVKKYAADNLRFVEFERKALPCALMRTKDNNSKSLYTYSAADMDARSVMEQRIQSMVCCFSMVGQVLLGNATAVGRDASSDSDPASSSAETASTPLVPFSPARAVREVWQRMQVIPALLEEHLVPVVKAQWESALQSYLNKQELVASHRLKENSSPSRTNQQDPDSPHLLPKKKRHMGSSPEKMKRHMQQLKKSANVEAVNRALCELKEIFKLEPTAMSKLREAILSIRKVLIGIMHVSTPQARVSQLVDVLLFWAHTSNFSTVRSFQSMESQPVQVCARELGSNIPRGKIFKMYRGNTEQSLRCRNKIDDIPEGCVASGSSGPFKALSPVHHLQHGVMGAATLDPPRCSSSNTECTSSLNMDAESAFSDELGVTSEESNSSSSLKEGATRDSSCNNYFIGPNEPVFIGAKRYSEHFIFWQLMGWYNAGTDEKTSAPEIFGCVELPLPSQCFGTTECNYGPKQREALLSQLKDDKQQTMPWPAVLRQSFSDQQLLLDGGSVSIGCRSPLYGSPMLDGALGKVGAVSQVLSMLLEEPSQDAPANEKRKGAPKTGSERLLALKARAPQQFDTILPPENPTSWVQCELCRQWRRVAWHVDSDSLPDQWECAMNTWDPEIATCSAPQDYYDPETENTLEESFNGAAATKRSVLEEGSAKVGTKVDLYCTKNRVYYEAAIKQIRKPRRAGETTRLLFHFLGWSSCFDEWVPIDSDRIAAHNLHTNPLVHDPREQEKWQGQLNLYDEFEKRTTATKITLIRKKPSSSSSTPAAVSSQASNPKKKRKRRSAPAKLGAAPPVVVASSSRRRGRVSVAAGESLLHVDADASVPTPVGSSDQDLQPLCASAPIQRSRGRALSADDDFADLYDSDGHYDSSVNGYQSIEEHLHNEDGNRADERDQCLQSNSAFDQPMDLQR